MIRCCRAPRALSVLAVALLLVPPLASARRGDDGATPGREFRAEGSWHRFRAFDGRECIPENGEGRFVAHVVVIDRERLRLTLEGEATCYDIGYTREVGETWILEGTPRKGYRYEIKEYCHFIDVGPLPVHADDPWEVATGDLNLALGGCEVFEGVGGLAPEPTLLPAIPLLGGGHGSGR